MRLKSLRESAGVSQAALAEQAGIGVSTLRQFEYGRREPTFGTLVKLAEGLGVSLAEFDAPAEELEKTAKARCPRGPPKKPR